MLVSAGTHEARGPSVCAFRPYRKTEISNVCSACTGGLKLKGPESNVNSKCLAEISEVLDDMKFWRKAECRKYTMGTMCNSLTPPRTLQVQL